MSNSIKPINIDVTVSVFEQHDNAALVNENEKNQLRVKLRECLKETLNKNQSYSELNSRSQEKIIDSLYSDELLNKLLYLYHFYTDKKNKSKEIPCRPIYEKSLCLLKEKKLDEFNTLYKITKAKVTIDYINERKKKNNLRIWMGKYKNNHDATRFKQLVYIKKYNVDAFNELQNKINELYKNINNPDNEETPSGSNVSELINKQYLSTKAAITYAYVFNQSKVRHRAMSALNDVYDTTRFINIFKIANEDLDQKLFAALTDVKNHPKAYKGIIEADINSIDDAKNFFQRYKERKKQRTTNYFTQHPIAARARTFTRWYKSSLDPETLETAKFAMSTKVNRKTIEEEKRAATFLYYRQNPIRSALRKKFSVYSNEHDKLLFKALSYKQHYANYNNYGDIVLQYRYDITKRTIEYIYKNPFAASTKNYLGTFVANKAKCNEKLFNLLMFITIYVDGDLIRLLHNLFQDEEKSPEELLKQLDEYLLAYFELLNATNPSAIKQYKKMLNEYARGFKLDWRIINTKKVKKQQALCDAVSLTKAEQEALNRAYAKQKELNRAYANKQKYVIVRNSEHSRLADTLVDDYTKARFYKKKKRVGRFTYLPTLSVAIGEGVVAMMLATVAPTLAISIFLGGMLCNYVLLKNDNREVILDVFVREKNYINSKGEEISPAEKWAMRSGLFIAAIVGLGFGALSYKEALGVALFSTFQMGTISVIPLYLAINTALCMTTLIFYSFADQVKNKTFSQYLKRQCENGKLESKTQWVLRVAFNIFAGLFALAATVIIADVTFGFFGPKYYNLFSSLFKFSAKFSTPASRVCAGVLSTGFNYLVWEKLTTLAMKCTNKLASNIDKLRKGSTHKDEPKPRVSIKDKLISTAAAIKHHNRYRATTGAFNSLTRLIVLAGIGMNTYGQASGPFSTSPKYFAVLRTLFSDKELIAWAAAISYGGQSCLINSYALLKSTQLTPMLLDFRNMENQRIQEKAKELAKSNQQPQGDQEIDQAQLTINNEQRMDLLETYVKDYLRILKDISQKSNRSSRRTILETLKTDTQRKNGENYNQYKDKVKNAFEKAEKSLSTTKIKTSGKKAYGLLGTKGSRFFDAVSKFNNRWDQVGEQLASTAPPCL